MNNPTTFDAMDEASAGSTSIIPHLPTIIGQRKWLFLAPALIGLIVGVAAAFLLPVTYQSKAVLLVEAPLLPEDVALDSANMEVVDQRMARIRQQVLSRPALFEIIQRNGLYQTELRIKTLSEVIEDMRQAIQITPVTAEIQNVGSGRRSTIAFSMSYDYSDPAKAQAVAQALTQQVLQIDATTSAEQATNTVQFLTDQAEGLTQQIAQLEQQISSIKANNGMALSRVGGMSVDSTVGYDTQIATIEQANSQLRAQRQMNATAAERDPVVQQAEAALAAAQAIYTDRHPDVVMAKQRLEEAKALAKTRQTSVPADAIDAQIASNNRQIAALRAARSGAAGAMAAQQRAPVLETQIAQLQQKLDGLNAQYQRVSTQLMSARAGKKAEDEQQGERLTVIDPPVTPDTPTSPNRPLLIAAGLGAGVGFGLFLILALELIFSPIRSVGSVTQVIGEPPLVVIPTIYGPGEKKAGFFASLWPFGGDDKDDD